MPPLRELGIRVRRARMRLPVVPTQAQAGDLVERSRRWWQELEAGRLDPQLGDLERVATLLGQPLGELLGLDAPMAGILRPEAADTRRRTFLALMTMLPATFDAERLAAALGVPRAIDRRVLDDLEAQGHE